jgi:hypothetical protein
MPFSPRLDILPRPQRALWPELAVVPPEFTLYGGTALALHLGHRESVDFDFFGTSKFDTFALASEMAFLEGAEVLRREEDTLDLSVVREGSPVKLSFFGLPSLPRIRQVETCPDNGLRVASLLDLAGTKVKTVQERAEGKDYVDIAALITDGRVSLPMALAAGAVIYGAQFNPQITLKALAYFGDGNLRELPEATRAVLTRAVGAVDLLRLPALDRTDAGAAGRGVNP